MIGVVASDLVGELQKRATPLYGITKSMMVGNAANMAYVDTLSLSNASVGINTLKQNEAIIPQWGTGHFYTTIGAKSYRHLDAESTVWGGAEFSTGRTRDIKWCNSVDYQLIAPYVLGDSVGGDLTFRRYDFYGGYARTINSRWTIGAQLDYRAEIAWRDVDPRIRTIVSDISLGIGISYRYSPNRIISLASALRQYSQNSDLEFYNPLNDIDTYPLTGLGTYYKRFAGNTNKNSGHSGLGYEASLQWLAVNGEGLQASVKFNSIRMNMLLRNFNNITLAYTNSYTACLKATYAANVTRSLRVQPVLETNIFDRKGTENLFGTAAGAAYDVIGSRTPYRHRIAIVDFGVPAELHYGRHIIALTPKASWWDSKESLSTAMLEVKDSDLAWGITGYYSWLTDSDWLFTLTGDYSSRVHSKLVRLTATRQCGKVAPTLSLGYTAMHIDNRIKSNSITTTINLTF